jgi:hypothetical protein
MRFHIAQSTPAPFSSRLQVSGFTWDGARFKCKGAVQFGRPAWRGQFGHPTYPTRRGQFGHPTYPTWRGQFGCPTWP